MTIQLRKLSLILTLFILFASAGIAQAQNTNQLKASLLRCDKSNSGFCTELRHDHQYFGHYSGHDEPALLFYSDKPGAGNNAIYHLTLPLDPPVPPQQDGSGGTFSFQLHPAFWYGMVLCDPQSSPNFTPVCVPKTDANIFDNADPNAPDFIGHHPGSAFLELQFYPPGGLNTCSDPKLWCVAMAIFSFNIQDLTGQINNLDCQNRVGLEPSNFAFLTANGISQTAADPLNPDPNGDKFAVIPGETFQMNPGDDLILDMHDTPAGLQVVIQDLTVKTTGSMTASIANGFAQVNFAPDPPAPQQPRTCTSTPFAFHPMYSTSSEHTRATWAAHTYNVAFSDEIGHFELCNAVDFQGGNCLQGVDDPNGIDDDDTGCFTGDFLALFGLQPIGTCINGDFDFDGESYQRRWAGTGSPQTDAQLKPTPLRFTSPQFVRSKGGGDNLTEYDRVAFEADLPDIEFESNPACDIINGGQGCTNPPNGAAFYPLLTAAKHNGQCVWQMGGPDIPGTTNNFGGSSTTEFGDISGVPFAEPATPDQPNGSSILIFGNFRKILDENPCRSGN